jgi:hypothetical protein
MKLFDAVARGLAAALIDLGPDPAAPTMNWSDEMSAVSVLAHGDPHTDVWPTLSEYVNTGISRTVPARKASGSHPFHYSLFQLPSPSNSAVER